MPDSLPASRFLVYSDVPPLGNEGANMAVLAHRVIRAIEPELAGVVTRAASSKYPRDQIGAGLEKPALLSWDCPGLGLRFIRGAARHHMDHLLLKAWAATHPQPTGIREVIGLPGPHWQFLPRLQALAKAAAAPYSIYVVDDFEVTATHAGGEAARESCHRGTGAALRAASRVFAICPGMAERLREIYQIESLVLYPLADDAPLSAQQAIPSGSARNLLYIGSLGPAYLAPLLETARALDELGGPWKLRIISRDHRTFHQHFAGFRQVDARLDASREQLRAEVAAADAIFMPYSFAPEWKLTAETSFPSKFMDAVGSGKPVIAYAPNYASITRHLRDAGLRFDAQNINDLRTLLQSEPWKTDESWRSIYPQLLEQAHSVRAARKILLGTGSA